MKKFIALVGGFTLLVLFTFSLMFFKERMLALDPPFFSFLVLQDEFFAAVLNRYGTWLSQIIPVLAIHNAVSLQGFLQLYSASFIFIYGAIFLALLRWDRKGVYAMGFVLYLTLCFRNTFYYPTAEIYIGAALAFFVPLILDNHKNKWRAIFSVFLIYVCSTFFHQLTLFPFLFLLWFGFDVKNKNMLKDNLILSGLFLVFFVLRLKLLTTSSYESSKIPELGDMLSQIPNLWSLPSTQYIWGNSFLGGLKGMGVSSGKLHWVIVLFLVIIIYLLLKRAYFKAVLTSAFNLGFILFILLFLYRGESATMYENYVSLFGIFTGLALAFALCEENKKWRRPELIGMALLLISMVGLRGIYQAHEPFKARNYYHKRASDYQRLLGKHKAIAHYNNIPHKVMGATWAEAHSALILSALDGPSTSTTLFVEQSDTLASFVKNKNHVFLGPYFEPLWWQVGDLNPNYFYLPWDEYQFLNTQQSPDLNWVDIENGVRIEGQKSYKIDANLYTDWSVYCLVRNWSNYNLPSLSNSNFSVEISYKLYNSNHELLREKNPKTPLEFDLWPHKFYTQRVEIEPLPKGEYILGIQLIRENGSGFGPEMPMRLRIE